MGYSDKVFKYINWVNKSEAVTGFDREAIWKSDRSGQRQLKLSGNDNKNFRVVRCV